MDDLELASYLRSLRRRAGFSQRDLADLIGYLSGDQISRHERADNLPSLLIALSYEAVFRVPVAELFPGIYESVKQEIELRLVEYEKTLQQGVAKGRKAPARARQLVWFTERNDSVHHRPTNAKGEI
jgi:transcriptional regulator with XRE-family HTH domain